MKSAHILIIEDSKSDIDLIIYQLKKNQIKNTIEVIYDGDDAIQYASQIAPLDPTVQPDLVLLDMNLPRIHGIEILKQLKQSNHCQDIPIIILSHQLKPAEKDLAESLGASAFIEKPLTYDKFLAAISSIPDISLSIVTNRG